MKLHQTQDNSSPPDAFEEALRNALHRREAPPAALTARLLAIPSENAAAQAPRAQSRLLRMPRLPIWVSAAVAAVLVVLVTFAGVTTAHVHRQHERAQQATRNFELATQIEEQVLAHTRQQLRSAGIELNHNE